MDKTELKNICSRWLWKAFETGTKQDPFSADNSEYWHPSIDLKWSKEMAEEIDEYTQQVSLLFAAWILKKVDIVLSDFLDDSWFEEWQKQK